ncbi:hypothetical protein GCM10023091_41580 [Ravibacter arvi]|uniref:Uncharacterized protein n=1 Tax=Ravibacter arvi TaxID=2051041 RepID=A0ABP8MC72_9BACT
MKTLLLASRFAVIVLLAFSCRDSDITGVERPQIDKTELLSRLTANERFWRIEYIIEVKGKDSTYLVHHEGTNDSLTWTKYIAYQFSNKMELVAKDCIGPFGETDYSDQDRLSTGSMSFEDRKGQWFWDEARQTIQLSNFFPKRTLSGHLDTNWLPTCRNAQEAKALGHPERMRLILHPDGNRNSVISYVYCLRAIWFLEVLSNDRQKSMTFRVLY